MNDSWSKTKDGFASPALKTWGRMIHYEELVYSCMQGGDDAVATCETLEGMTGGDILTRFLQSVGLQISILDQASSFLCHCRHVPALRNSLICSLAFTCFCHILYLLKHAQSSLRVHNVSFQDTDAEAHGTRS